MDQIDGTNARKGARRMEEILKRQSPFSQTMQGEKWSQQAVLLEIVTGGLNHDPVPDMRKLGQSSSRLPTWVKRKMLVRVTRDFNQAVAITEKPYASRPPEPSSSRDAHGIMPIPESAHMLQDIISPTYYQSWFTATKCQAQNALLAIAFALRAYRAEHGHYPDSLSELAPAYLKKIPSDPFALKDTPGYKKSGDNYVLYSIGPDGRDDGGKVSANSAKSTDGVDRRHFVFHDSTGDIVAGVNR